MKATISFYITLFLRRVHWFILIFGIIAAASVTIARILPPVYLASTRLLVEPPQIPSQLAASTVQTSAQEELQIIEQRLMTRVNLLEIARSEQVFDEIGTMSPDEVVRGMRDATRIRRSAGQGQATLMNLSFESPSASVAANVVNRYVTLILQDNAALRAGRAGTTLEFFEVEVERLGNELEEKSAAILDFNNANADALPSTLGFRLTQQTNIQSRLAVIDRDIANLRDQRQRLVDVFQNTGTVSTQNQQNLTPEQRKLAQLEDQLNSALAIYSQENPRVKILQAQIAAQREVVRNQAGVQQQQAADQEAESVASILDIQLADIDNRILALENEKTDAKAQLDKLIETIERTPSVQIALNALNRDYNNIQQQYNNAVSGLSKAATGERIELLAKGQRISVIDPATVPNRPDRPNRLMIAAGGSAFGAFLGLAVIAALEFLNNSIRRPVEITRKLGITPLATVPYVRTPFEMVTRRAGFVVLLATLMIGIPALLYAIHTFYLPLDLIYERIASRLGTIL